MRPPDPPVVARPPEHEHAVRAAAVASGGLAFVATCAASQFAQLALNVHTGYRIFGGARLVPSLLGACTVGCASVASLEAAALVTCALSDPASNPSRAFVRRTATNPCFSLGNELCHDICSRPLNPDVMTLLNPRAGPAGQNEIL